MFHILAQARKGVTFVLQHKYWYGLAVLSNGHLLCVVSIMRDYMFMLYRASGSDSSMYTALNGAITFYLRKVLQLLFNHTSGMRVRLVWHSLCDWCSAYQLPTFAQTRCLAVFCAVVILRNSFENPRLIHNSVNAKEKEIFCVYPPTPPPPKKTTKIKFQNKTYRTVGTVPAPSTKPSCEQRRGLPSWVVVACVGHVVELSDGFCFNQDRQQAAWPCAPLHQT